MPRTDALQDLPSLEVSRSLHHKKAYTCCWPLLAARHAGSKHIAACRADAHPCMQSCCAATPSGHGKGRSRGMVHAGNLATHFVLYVKPQTSLLQNRVLRVKSRTSLLHNQVLTAPGTGVPRIRCTIASSSRAKRATAFIQCRVHVADTNPHA